MTSTHQFWKTEPQSKHKRPFQTTQSVLILETMKKIPFKFKQLSINTVFSFQRSFKEQLEVYSTKHFPESEATDRHVRRVNLICFTVKRYLCI